jgi:mannose/fructose/N-acetylgalactosamine-specific phosphotransferase system component IID
MSEGATCFQDLQNPKYFTEKKKAVAYQTDLLTHVKKFYCIKKCPNQNGHLQSFNTIHEVFQHLCQVHLKIVNSRANKNEYSARSRGIVDH